MIEDEVQLRVRKLENQILIDLRRVSRWVVDQDAAEVEAHPWRSAPSQEELGAFHPQFHTPGLRETSAEPPDVSDLVGRNGFCPACTSVDIRRARRKGVFEKFLRLFCIAPFRCRSCRRKFYRF